MSRKKNRQSIPEELAAKVLFVSDRVCCVCRIKKKPVQIHHIDEDPSNNSFENLAVLCFDCHLETQISGGFHRKLNAEQVTLYRSDWIVRVARLRVNYSAEAEAHRQDSFFDFEIVTQLAEIFREKRAFDLLAMHYDSIGNMELRDKYIELAINNGLDDDGVIYFRHLQGQAHLLPTEIIERRIEKLQENDDLFNLGRLYYNLGQYEKALETLCLNVIDSLESGNNFHAAYAIKEMVEEGVVEALFTIALKEARESNDLWQQYRTLQELGWYTEIADFLKSNQKEIEASDNSALHVALADVLQDKVRYKKAIEKDALMLIESESSEE